MNGCMYVKNTPEGVFIESVRTVCIKILFLLRLLIKKSSNWQAIWLIQYLTS